MGWLPELGTLAQRTLLLLWTFGRVDVPVSLVWPSARTLADALGSHPSRIREAVRELETAGALARVSGDFSHVRTRARFQARRRLLALFAHPGARVATREASHDGPALNKKTLRYRPPTEQKSIALASPEQLTINSNLIKNPSSSSIGDCGVAAPAAQKRDDDDDDVGGILASVDAVTGAIPWAATIRPAQRERLAELGREHGAAELGRALVAVRRDLVRRGKIGLTGPAMLDPAAWARVWAHHAPAMLRAMRPPPERPRPVSATLGPLGDAPPGDVADLLDSLLTHDTETSDP